MYKDSNFTIDITESLKNGTSGVKVGDNVYVGVVPPTGATAGRIRIQKSGGIMGVWLYAYASRGDVNQHGEFIIRDNGQPVGLGISENTTYVVEAETAQNCQPAQTTPCTWR
jgi:hypothetical protein